MRALVLVLVVSSALLGCDSADPQGEVSLEPGSVRIHAFRSTMTDSAGVVSAVYTDTIRTRIVGRGRSVEGLEGLTEVEYESLVTGMTARTWYRESAEQLVEVAYEQVPIPVTAQLRGAPEVARRSLDVLAGVLFGGGEEVVVREDPRIVLAYPLEVGQGWISFTNPFLSERRVEREETVHVPAGSYVTTVIATKNSLALVDFEWLDWLDDGGLVQRRIRSEQIRMDENGESIGLVVIEDEATLIREE